MGNAVFCFRSVRSLGSSGAAKVILPCGEVRCLNRPANAAEVMLDTPGHFLVNSRSMKVGRRLVALSADEDLEMANVYVMMPMKRLNSTITEADMAPLLPAAGKEVRKKRILPESPPSSRGSPNNPVAGPELAEAEDDVRAAMLEFKYRMSVEFKNRLTASRLRKPSSLETIAEEGLFNLRTI